MPNYSPFISKSIEISKATFKQDRLDNKDKEFFRPFGTQIYIGPQGSGKTLSLVKHARDLIKRYPKAKLVSNILLKKKYFPDYIYYQSVDDLRNLLKNVQNDKYGVIYLCDEAHTYFNALDSKNIPLDVFQYISQQRKQHKLFLGTSQLFARMAKPWREQCDLMIYCRCGWWNKMVFQEAYDAQTLVQDFDGSFSGTVVKKGRFFQRLEYRNAYDTYQIIDNPIPEINKQFDAITPTNINIELGKRSTHGRNSSQLKAYKVKSG